MTIQIPRSLLIPIHTILLTAITTVHTQIFAHFFALYPYAIPLYTFSPFSLLTIILPILSTTIGLLLLGHVLSSSKRKALNLITYTFLLSSLSMLTIFILAFVKHEYNYLSVVVVSVVYYFTPALGASVPGVLYTGVSLLSAGEENVRSMRIYAVGGAGILGFLVGSGIGEVVFRVHWGFVIVLGAEILLGLVAVWIGRKITEESEVAAHQEEGDETDGLVTGGAEEVVEVKEEGFFEGYKTCLLESKSLTRWSFGLFFLMGITKAMAPVGFMHVLMGRLEDYEKIWVIYYLCPIISSVILAGVLPLTLWKSSWNAGRISLIVGRVSIVLLALGTVLVGAVRSLPIAVAGLIITALGAATDFSILASIAGDIDPKMNGRTIMLMAAFESLGRAVGVATLFPAYSWSNTQPGHAGGLTFVICAGIYAVGASVLFFKFKCPTNRIVLI
ncbi:hypothetical protein QBC38DRAFT_43992 [Podospora fimiseda]|uniref:Uncharacterized protein n=1 Tax=Podospora fimiseda TaxID=252190 RepID=A0AAN7BI37_9PEZI|nr:hypothetical protein QBC38DRAFT_43992 [Podospora fimiseda]